MNTSNDERVLVVAPSAGDAALSQALLTEAGLTCHICLDLHAVCREFRVGAGAILLTEECLGGHDTQCFVDLIQEQPTWSDVPVILLCDAGADSVTAVWAMERLGNVIVMERPIRVTTLVSTLRTGLKARRRQYELRNQIEAVQESEARFRLLADHAPVLIWVNGLDGCEFVNRAYLEFVGRTAEEVRGMQWAQTLHPDDKDTYLAEYARAVQSRGTFEAPVRFRRQDGEYRWLKSVGLPRFTPDQRFLGYVGCSLDITDLKRYEETLRQADRLKDEFLAMLAHELRNPLAPIRNALHIMKLPSASGEIIEQAREMAERQVQHMARLLDDLLDVSRISRGRIELRKELVDVAALMKRIEQSVRPLMEDQRHQLTVSSSLGPLFVDADPARLEQVLSNLLNNAAKYTDPGGQIWLSAEREAEQVVLRVRDTGIGIATEMLPRIFDIFVQVERRLDRSQGGIGIGLTLVKRLVELHGGSIQVFSDGPGHGSEFVVRLPFHPPPGASPGESSDSGRVAPTKPGYRVLVVDDNHDAADSLAMLLRLGGHQVQVAYDGPEALELAQAFQPQVAFLDIGMPGMDGYEVARRLRKLEGDAAAVLVALTGWGHEEDRRRSLRAGFDGHLVKPADPNALRDFFAQLAPADGTLGEKS